MTESGLELQLYVARWIHSYVKHYCYVLYVLPYNNLVLSFWDVMKEKWQFYLSIILLTQIYSSHCIIPLYVCTLLREKGKCFNYNMLDHRRWDAREIWKLFSINLIIQIRKLVPSERLNNLPKAVVLKLFPKQHHLGIYLKCVFLGSTAFTLNQKPQIRCSIHSYEPP